MSQSTVDKTTTIETGRPGGYTAGTYVPASKGMTMEDMEIDVSDHRTINDIAHTLHIGRSDIQFVNPQLWAQYKLWTEAVDDGIRTDQYVILIIFPINL